MGGTCWLFQKFYRLVRLSRSDHIDGSIDCCPAQVALLFFKRGGAGIPAKQAEKHSLQHVLSVRSVAENSIGSAENQAMIGSIDSLEFVGNRDYWFLGQRTLQVTPPSTPSRLKTAEGMNYYSTIFWAT